MADDVTGSTDVCDKSEETVIPKDSGSIVSELVDPEEGDKCQVVGDESQTNENGALSSTDENQKTEDTTETDANEGEVVELTEEMVSSVKGSTDMCDKGDQSEETVIPEDSSSIVSELIDREEGDKGQVVEDESPTNENGALSISGENQKTDNATEMDPKEGEVVELTEEMASLDSDVNGLEVENGEGNDKHIDTGITEKTESSSDPEIDKVKNTIERNTSSTSDKTESAAHIDKDSEQLKGDDGDIQNTESQENDVENENENENAKIESKVETENEKIESKVQTEDNQSSSSISQRSESSMSNISIDSSLQEPSSSASEKTSAISETTPSNNTDNKLELNRVLSSDRSSLGGSELSSQNTSPELSPTKNPSKVLQTQSSDDNDLLEELDSELSHGAPNGLKPSLNLSQVPEHKALKKRYQTLQTCFVEKELEITRLKENHESLLRLADKSDKEATFYKKKLEEVMANKKDGGQQQKELEQRVQKLSAALQESHEKLSSHDAAARKAVAALQDQLKLRVAEVTRLYEDCKKDKESMVMKYAMAEQKNIKIVEDMNKTEARMKEMQRERELMIKKYHYTKTEKCKMDDDFQNKNSEISSLKKEVEKQKELLSSSVMKAKWAENKLHSETDQHRETKAKLDKIQLQLAQAREEAEQVRKDCQGMLKSYQDSEDMKSSTLAVELRQRENELQSTKQEQGDKEEVHKMMRGQLDNLKRKHKEIIDELKTYKDKTRSLDMERQHQEASLNKYQETLQKQKTEISGLHEKLRTLETASIDLKKERDIVESLTARVAELEEAHRELTADMDSCAARETEHLTLQQKISEQNARLTAENNRLANRFAADLADYDVIKVKVVEMEKELDTVRSQLHDDNRNRKEEADTLNEQLREKTRKIAQLLQEVDDGKDEIKTLKRKHANNVKDVSRQLQQAKKRLEVFEARPGSTERDSVSMGSMGSRTSSSGSLDTVAAGQNGRGASVEPKQPPPQEEEQPIVQVVEIDKQVLMEKIVRLQKAHARKNEKLEFMEDHINQLLKEVRKKTRIIQNYAMRDEAGALAPPSMDYNKVKQSIQAQLAQKGPGIMAAVYSQHSKDGGSMTLELSLEINHKLQALLEDALLKNITLKDNLDTLGAEIARLSQENRRIQLQMQASAPS